MSRIFTPPFTPNPTHDIVCNACGDVLVERTIEGCCIRVPVFAQITGLEKDLGTTKLPDGTEIQIREHPQVCATPECIARILSDSRWTKLSVEDWARRREEGRKRLDDLPKHPAEDDPRLGELDEIRDRTQELTSKINTLVDDGDAEGLLALSREARDLEKRASKLCEELWPRSIILRGHRSYYGDTDR